MYVRMYVYMCVCIHTYFWCCMCLCVHMYISMMYVRTCMHTWSYMRWASHASYAYVRIYDVVAHRATVA